MALLRPTIVPPKIALSSGFNTHSKVTCWACAVITNRKLIVNKVCNTFFIILFILNLTVQINIIKINTTILIYEYFFDGRKGNNKRAASLREAALLISIENSYCFTNFLIVIPVSVCSWIKYTPLAK